MPRRSVALVVEDDEALREEMVDLLRRDGHDVLEAPEGGRALSILRQVTPVNLILLDLWMPGMDGWSFRAEQRADRALRDIPVVVLTADDSAQARAIDAAAVIRKPFEGNLLCSTVRRVIAERRLDTKGKTELLADTVSLLAGAVSHEIANPLMALIGGLERAKGSVPSSEPGAPDAAGGVEWMLEQCWRIAGALRTLRDLPYPHWTREGDVDVAQVLRAAAAWAATGGVRVSVEADATAMVRGDRLVVLYLCTAILRNAVEAVPVQAAVPAGSPPEVEVRLHQRGNQIILEVCDHGLPIPDEDLLRLFTVDYAGRERAWGMGLRLWFVREAVEALGGSIDIGNRLQGGVRCRVRLPAGRVKPQQV